MEEVKTRFGTCKVEKTGVEYQVVAYYNKLDDEDIDTLKEYFNNIGKFEELMKGICITTKFLGSNPCKQILELSRDDIEEPIDIHKSQERKRMGSIDIFFRGRKLNKYEKKESVKDRIDLDLKTIAHMIENIEKYEELKKSISVLKEL